MKLSIIIPVYNAEKYIEECLDSIISEIDEQVEVLLLDDGSTDHSYQMIKNYERKNIRIFHHENHGVSYTRNQGIKEASGEYLMFVDSDDKLLPCWKKTVFSQMKDNAEIVYFNRYVSAPGEVRNKLDLIYGIFGIQTFKVFGNLSSPCGKLYARRLLEKKRILFNEELINGEDALFNLNALLQADHCTCASASFYQYRVYMGSSSKRYSKNFFDSNLRFFAVAESILREGQVEEKVIQRCMSYSVTYSVYLYLFLVSTLSHSVEKKLALKRINDFSLQKYMNRYPMSHDCGKLVQIVYLFVKHHFLGMASLLIDFRNVVRGKKKKDVQWVEI